MMLSLPPPPPLSPTSLRPSLKSPCVAVSACLLGTGTPLAARVEVMDTWGDHALSCCCGGDRVLRHYAIRNVVCFAVAEFTSVSPELEKNPVFCFPASSRPEGTLPELTRALTLLAVAAPMSGFLVAFPDSPRRGIFRFHLCCAPPHISSAAPLGRRCFETRKRAFQDTASLSWRLAEVDSPPPSRRSLLGFPTNPVLCMVFPVPRHTRPAPMLHPSLGKRACNPSVVSRGRGWFIWFDGRSGWCIWLVRSGLALYAVLNPRPVLVTVLR